MTSPTKSAESVLYETSSQWVQDLKKTKTPNMHQRITVKKSSGSCSIPNVQWISFVLRKTLIEQKKVETIFQLSQEKRSRRTSCFCHNPIFALFSSVAIQRDNERTKNKEIITWTWVWGLVLRVCVRCVRVWKVRMISSACIYQFLRWVCALCALKQC